MHDIKVDLFNLPAMQKYFVHPSSVVEEGAVIGDGTSVWHFSHVMPGAVIGDNCIFGQNTFIDNNVRTGNGVKVQNNVSLYNGVTLEDWVFIGPSVVFTNVINPRSFIERKHEFRSTLVKKGATIGANATVICGCEIGEFSIVAAGSVVTKNVEAYSLVVGTPAEWRGWISESGQKLNFNENGEASCPDTGDAYQLSDGVVQKI